MFQGSRTCLRAVGSLIWVRRGIVLYCLLHQYLRYASASLRSPVYVQQSAYPNQHSRQRRHQVLNRHSFSASRLYTLYHYLRCFADTDSSIRRASGRSPAGCTTYNFQSRVQTPMLQPRRTTVGRLWKLLSSPSTIHIGLRSACTPNAPDPHRAIDRVASLHHCNISGLSGGTDRPSLDGHRRLSSACSRSLAGSAGRLEDSASARASQFAPWSLYRTARSVSRAASDARCASTAGAEARSSPSNSYATAFPGPLGRLSLQTKPSLSVPKPGIPGTASNEELGPMVEAASNGALNTGWMAVDLSSGCAGPKFVGAGRSRRCLAWIWRS